MLLELQFRVSIMHAQLNNFAQTCTQGRGLGAYGRRFPRPRIFCFLRSRTQKQIVYTISAPERVVVRLQEWLLWKAAQPKVGLISV